MIKINWTPFFDNTSTREALADFVEGESLKNSFAHIKWPTEVVKQLPAINKLPVKIARARAKAALKR
jgi:hypothetical protein